MEALTRTCPVCRAISQEGTACANCGSELMEHVVDYPRSVAYEKRLSRHSPSSLLVSVLWSLNPFVFFAGAALTAGVQNIRFDLARPGDFIFLAMCVLQVVGGLALIYGPRLTRWLVGFHAGTIAFFVSRLLVIDRPTITKNTDVVMLTIIAIELLLAVGVVWHCARAILVDNRRVEQPVSGRPLA